MFKCLDNVIQAFVFISKIVFLHIEIFTIMDIKNSLDYRYEYFKKYDLSGNNRYKYEEDGILTKCLPKILFKGNTILTTFLQLIDLRLIMMFKNIDRIKKFKYISNYL